MKRTSIVAGTALVALLPLTGAAQAALVQSASTPSQVDIDAAANPLQQVDSAQSSIAGGRGTVSDGAVGPTLPVDVSISFP